MDKKGFGFLLLAVLLIVSAMVFLPAVQDTVQAQEPAVNISGEVEGWMWSNNIGWISLDSNETEPVKIVSNQFIGYGWSESVGWINFAPGSYTGKDPSHGVRIDATGVNPYPLSGWARACSVFVTGCSGPLKTPAELGGWDGWIKMVDAKYDTSDKSFDGYAWGNLNLGWVGFYAGFPDDSSGCTTGLNCTCDDPEPPPGCPHCEGCACDNSCGDDFTVTCSASPDAPKVNENVTFTANVSPTTGIYTYLWTGEVGIPRPETKSFIISYNATGTKNVDLVVTNSDGDEKSANCQTSTGGKVCVCLDGYSCNADGDCIPDVEPCTLFISSPSKSLISYYLNEASNLTKAKKAEVEISNCGSNISLQTGVNPATNTDLDSAFEIICSDNNDLNPLDYTPCTSLSDGTYYIWVKPRGTTLPSSEIKKNIFNILVGGEEGPEAVKSLRFDYIVIAG
jgi:hypothetical protein